MVYNIWEGIFMAYGMYSCNNMHEIILISDTDISWISYGHRILGHMDILRTSVGCRWMVIGRPWDIHNVRL
jgi:hypothetical protein